MIWVKKKKVKFEWHLWFAWCPVAIKVSKSERHIVWLQRVWRKAEYFDGFITTYEYSASPESRP